MSRANAPTRPAAPSLLPQVWRVSRRLRDVAAIWGSRRVDPKLREEVMLAVAQANDCRLCTMAHRRWALAEGVSDAEIAALENQDATEFDRRSWAAIAWADARARADLGPAPPEFEEELARHYTPAERDDLELVALVMTIANRAANALDALLARLRAVSASRASTR